MNEQILTTIINSDESEALYFPFRFILQATTTSPTPNYLGSFLTSSQTQVSLFVPP
ncbi:hypothetical protein LguiB_031408 [Lonicera macranthoides]